MLFASATDAAAPADEAAEEVAVTASVAEPVCCGAVTAGAFAEPGTDVSLAAAVAGGMQSTGERARESMSDGSPPFMCKCADIACAEGVAGGRARENPPAEPLALPRGLARALALVVVAAAVAALSGALSP